MPQLIDSIDELNEMDGFEVVLKAGIRHFPHHLGFLFHPVGSAGGAAAYASEAYDEEDA